MVRKLWEEEEVPKPKSPDEPYHIRWVRDFIDTQLDIFDATDVDVLLNLKNEIEKCLVKIQETQEDPYLHEEVPYRN